MSKKSMSRLHSFRHSVRGFKVVLQEPNALIHVVLAAVAIALGVYLHIRTMEWVAVVLAISLVLGAEALNTGIEKAVDLASPEWHATAGQAKDAAAAAVLICSIGAAVVGALIFLPKLAETIV